MTSLKNIAVLTGVILAVNCAAAHDIPSDVTVQAFIKPAGDRLNLLVRVPLRAMREVDFPLSAASSLDLSRTAPLLPDIAQMWISDFIDIYENNSVLPKPRVVATRVSLESDRSFADYSDAFAHVTGAPLAPGTPSSSHA